ncbi:DUF58 domain-containing protein [Bdellovibrio bacteriovorus]|uniref:DUF58 domain-containing protein n=1 Tax=Bdellovibrio bacteriovorus TaxID=959 RepID=UPI0035A6FAF7
MASNEVVSGPMPFKKRLQSLFKKKKRTYIMPSRFGMAFGAMALTLFFLAVGYANNLIYIFVFFLISVAFTGILLTNKNMDVVQVEGLENEELFVGEEGLLRISLENPSVTPAWDVEAVLGKDKNTLRKTSIKPLSHGDLQIPYRPGKRGWVKLPRITLQSTYPFGLLRAWKYMTSQDSVLVYPARLGEKQFPTDAVAGEGQQATGLFRDHRGFQSADSLSRIDWRASARRQDLLVKNYEEPEKPALHFRWEQTESLSDLEMRISQLCLWVDEAERQGFQYSLSVGPQEIKQNKGPHHREACLTVLALLYPEALS